MITHDMIQMRMQEEIDELRDALEQRKPLTDEQVMYLAKYTSKGETKMYVDLCRIAAAATHGVVEL